MVKTINNFAEFMRRSSISTLLKKNMMVIALIIVTIFFAIGTKGTILYPQNINNLIAQNGYVFVLGTGMLLCILTGGNIDLSVGSIVCFTGAIGAKLMESKVPAFVAVLAMLVVGLLIGAFQGFWIAWVNVPPFIATLAGMYAFRGLTNAILHGFAVGINNKGFLDTFGGGADCYIPDFLGGKYMNIVCVLVGVIGVLIFVLINVRKWMTNLRSGLVNFITTGEVAKVVIMCSMIFWIALALSNFKGIPTVLIWIGLVLVIYGYITTNTAIGRYLYAVGGNEKATRLSGINTKLVYFFAYVNMGFLAGLAGVLTIARIPQITSQAGTGYEMDAIAACFIGGASAYGGVGKITGVILGATLMGIINYGMNLMGVSSNYQRAVKGAVLLIAVLMDVLSKKEQG